MIACAGLYGTLAYNVARRTKEIGIRIAVGAKRQAVIWMLIKELLLLAALAVLISIPIGQAASAFLESFLFRTTPGDPAAVATGLTALLITVIAASYGPARRATRIDPVTALRHE